METRL